MRCTRSFVGRTQAEMESIRKHCGSFQTEGSLATYHGSKYTRAGSNAWQRNHPCNRKHGMRRGKSGQHMQPGAEP
jgi:hypothetical protein